GVLGDGVDEPVDGAVVPRLGGEELLAAGLVGAAAARRTRRWLWDWAARSSAIEPWRSSVRRRTSVRWSPARSSAMAPAPPTTPNRPPRMTMAVAILKPTGRSQNHA